MRIVSKAWGQGRGLSGGWAKAVTKGNAKQKSLAREVGRGWSARHLIRATNSSPDSRKRAEWMAIPRSFLVWGVEPPSENLFQRSYASGREGGLGPPHHAGLRSRSARVSPLRRPHAHHRVHRAAGSDRPASAAHGRQGRTCAISPCGRPRLIVHPGCRILRPDRSDPRGAGAASTRA